MVRSPRNKDKARNEIEIPYINSNPKRRKKHEERLIVNGKSSQLLGLYGIVIAAAPGTSDTPRAHITNMAALGKFYSFLYTTLHYTRLPKKNSGEVFSFFLWTHRADLKWPLCKRVSPGHWAGRPSCRRGVFARLHGAYAVVSRHGGGRVCADLLLGP